MSEKIKRENGNLRFFYRFSYDEHDDITNGEVLTLPLCVIVNNILHITLVSTRNSTKLIQR